jgi:hypothetical protein
VPQSDARRVASERNYPDDVHASTWKMTTSVSPKVLLKKDNFFLICDFTWQRS